MRLPFMRRSVRDLAEEVDAALGVLAQAQGAREEALELLRLADADIAAAQAKVDAARDALFQEHPELAPTTSPTPAPPPTPGQWEHVEVDDPDDGPIEWTEHDVS